MNKKLHVKFYYYSKVPSWIENIKPFEHCLDLGTFDNEEDAREKIMGIVNNLELSGRLDSWYTDETYIENKEENTMTNAEMAKQIKEFNERLDRYYANQEEMFNEHDSNIGELYDEHKEFEDRFDRCVKNLGELNEKTKSVKQRLDSMDDTTEYVRQVAEESKKIEEALKVSTRKLDLFSQKNLELMEKNKRLSEQNVQLQEDIKAANKMCDSVSKKASKLADRVLKLEENSRDARKAKILESMYPCLWNCEHRGKECNGQAQECPIAEHFSEQLKNSILGDKFEDVIQYMENDVASAAGIKPIWTDDAVEKMARPILFSKFNAGKMAIVFEGNDSLEAAYLEFWREFDEWCRTSEMEDKMYPQSKWPTREKRMNPLMKCPSIYKDHSSFAIWMEHDVEEGEHTFEYGTLMTDWREHKTVGGLPYTVWKI